MDLFLFGLNVTEALLAPFAQWGTGVALKAGKVTFLIFPPPARPAPLRYTVPSATRNLTFY